MSDVIQNPRVMDGEDRVGGALRILASRGWAGEDAEVVAELMRQARDLAVLVGQGRGDTDEARRVADELLAGLADETVG